MDDLISRQAAIDAIWEVRITPGGELFNAIKRAQEELIKQLPTVQPERKKGKWKNHIEDGYLECPFCGAATNCDGDESELHFCFSCGAKMIGGDDDV